MSSIERVRWFLGELRRVKSGLAGFVLLFILIGLTLAFPLLANPQDIANWSGHAKYWEDKMLPRLAPPAWVNYVSPVKYPVTHDLHKVYVSRTLLLNMSKAKDLLKYLQLMNPKIAKTISKLPKTQQKVILNALRKNLDFKYIMFKEVTVVYNFKADVPPKNIIVLLKIGPIYMTKGLIQGFNILLTRPDGITISLLPGSSTNLTNPFNINSYAQLNSGSLIAILGLNTERIMTKSGTILYVPPGTIIRFSLYDYLSSIVNQNNPALISEIFGPIFSKLNMTSATNIYTSPMQLLMSRLEPAMINGTAPLLKGKYKLTFAMLIKVPKFETALAKRYSTSTALPTLEVTRARVLGVYGILGTDIHGRDLWPAILYGLRWALIIGITVAVLSTLIGVFYGVISGYLGGYVDTVMTRVAQVVYSLPVLPLLIMLSYFFGPSIWHVVIILVAFGWSGLVFTVRSMVLQIKENLYVEAARAIGASSWRIIFKHVFPQVLPYTFASMALSVPGAILAEAGLSYLGLGDPNIVTWGKILHDAHANGAVLKGAWWWVIPPGLGIAIVGMTFVFIGYALDRILNPRLIR